MECSRRRNLVRKHQADFRRGPTGASCSQTAGLIRKSGRPVLQALRPVHDNRKRRKRPPVAGCIEEKAPVRADIVAAFARWLPPVYRKRGLKQRSGTTGAEG